MGRSDRSLRAGQTGHVESKSVSSGLGFACLGRHVLGFYCSLSRIGRRGGPVEDKTNPYLRDKTVDGR